MFFHPGCSPHHASLPSASKQAISQMGHLFGHNRVLHAGLGEHGYDQIQDHCELHVTVFSDDCLVPASTEDYAHIFLGKQ